jgi:hypothetical protein
MSITQQQTALHGGEWIIKESNSFDTFIPEDFNEEQKMVMDMCHQFLEAEIHPNIERIDKQEQGLVAYVNRKSW